MSFEEITKALRLTLDGEKDASGKTPLDLTIEGTPLDSMRNQDNFVHYLIELFPHLVEEGPKSLKLGRYLIRRTHIKDRRLADTLRVLLAERPARENREIRLWLMLALMDLGFAPTIATLNADQEVRTKHTGEWLTLVSANESYVDVKDAFVKAASDKLLSERLLILKVDGIRKQFGNKLHDFLSSVIPAFSHQDEKNAIASMQKMYGINLKKTRKTSGKKRPWFSPIPALSSFSQKAFRVLKIVGDDANRRAERREVA